MDFPKQLNNLSKDVCFIINSLNRNGFEAFIVGGCVRDMLMNVTPKDWDITTQALPEQVKHIFPKTIDTGIKHGTVTVLLNKTAYEVTTYRIDGEYFDGRRPDEVFFTTNIEEDLLRRDFTINAIAYHENHGFVDPFWGMKDIKQKTIKGVGLPEKRFQEDGLRMMRAIRFSAQLDFQIEENTYNALKKNAYLIEKVSIERIRDEFIKIVLTNNPQYVANIVESGLFRHIYTKGESYILKYAEQMSVAIAGCKKDIVLRLSLLFLYFPKQELEDFLKFFRYDNKTIKDTCIITHWSLKQLEMDVIKIRQYLSAIDTDYFDSVIYIKYLLEKYKILKNGSLTEIKNIKNKIIENGDAYKICHLKINGNDLHSIGFPKGKVIGTTLNLLLQIVIYCPHYNTGEKLEQLALKVKNKDNFYNTNPD